MAAIANDGATSKCLPNLHDATNITRSDICSVSRRAGHRKDTFVVTSIDIIVFSRGDIPDADSFISRTRGNIFSARRPGNRKYIIAVIAIDGSPPIYRGGLLISRGEFLRHRLVFSWSFNKQIDGMRQNRQDILEALFDSFWTAGKIDNQGSPTRTYDATGKHTKGCFLQTDHAHGFGNARCLALNHSFCRLWCDISWSQSCSPGGEDEMEVFLVAPLAQDSFNTLLLVGNDSTRTDHHLG